VAIKVLGREVRFGLQYNFRNPPGAHSDAAALYAATFEHMQEAEHLGFDYLWTTEHHFMPDGYSPSVLPLCAAIAAKTSRIRLGTQILIVPLYDPLRLAEDIATVDLISGGRFELGVGLGYRLAEFEKFGVEFKSRGRRADEALTVVRAALHNEEVSYSGSSFTYERVRVMPRPVQTRIPIWLGANSGAGARRAARVADGLLGAAHAEEFQKEWRRLGRSGEPRVRIGAVPWAFVSEDPEAAWSRVGPYVLYQREMTNTWMADSGRPTRFAGLPETAGEAVAMDVVVTPERAMELITQIVSESDADAEVLLQWYAIPPGCPPHLATESITSFAQGLFHRRHAG
jgi:probable F420-dependent oxidoreductase